MDLASFLCKIQEWTRSNTTWLHLEYCILRFQQEAEGTLRWSSVVEGPLRVELRETTRQLGHLETNLSNNRRATWPPEERGKVPWARGSRQEQLEPLLKRAGLRPPWLLSLLAHESPISPSQFPTQLEPWYGPWNGQPSQPLPPSGRKQREKIRVKTVQLHCQPGLVSTDCYKIRKTLSLVQAL